MTFLIWFIGAIIAFFINYKLCKDIDTNKDVTALYALGSLLSWLYVVFVLGFLLAIYLFHKHEIDKPES